jgi:hypothetical protein
MNQVHKENLTHVENANPGRQGLEIEIFGMEGVPAEIIDQHNRISPRSRSARESLVILFADCMRTVLRRSRSGRG